MQINPSPEAFLMATSWLLPGSHNAVLTENRIDLEYLYNRYRYGFRSSIGVVGGLRCGNWLLTAWPQGAGTPNGTKGCVPPCLTACPPPPLPRGAPHAWKVLITHLALVALRKCPAAECTAPAAALLKKRSTKLRPTG